MLDGRQRIYSHALSLLRFPPCQADPGDMQANADALSRLGFSQRDVRVLWRGYPPIAYQTGAGFWGEWNIRAGLAIKRCQAARARACTCQRHMLLPWLALIRASLAPPLNASRTHTPR